MSTMSCGSGIEKKVSLKCSDGKIVEVEETVALESETIKKKMVEATSADEVIQLEKVSSKVLSKIMFYCRMYVVARRENREDEIKTWDLDFVIHCLDTDFDLYSGAKYLQIMSLVEFIDQQFELLSAAKQEQEQEQKVVNYGKIMSSDDPINQPFEKDWIVTRLNNNDPGQTVRRRRRPLPSGFDAVPKYLEVMSVASFDLNTRIQESAPLPSANRLPVERSAIGDHKETPRGLLKDRKVEVSTYITDDFQKMIALINCILELLSAVFDQLSSVQKPQYAIGSMKLSLFTMFLCIVELICKGIKGNVTWEWRSILPWLYYPPENDRKPFGNFKDIMGLIFAICQCTFATINVYFARRHAANPFKVCFWPILFALGLLCSKYLE